MNRYLEIEENLNNDENDPDDELNDYIFNRSNIKKQSS
jgi:hypothetical protein